MRKIVCKPIEEIELEFTTGERLILRFDINALMHFEEIGGIEGIAGETSVRELCAKVIYAGGKETAKDLTLEQARTLTQEIGVGAITEIIDVFNESMGTEGKAEELESAKKQMAQFLGRRKK